MNEPTVPIETWSNRIEAARRRRDQLVSTWQTYARLHTNAYIAHAAKNDDVLVQLPNGDQVKLGLVYRNIEQTMALLEVPEIGIRASITETRRELTNADSHREGVVEAALVRSLKRSGFVKGPEEVDAIKRDGIIIGHGINYSWWRQVKRRVETGYVAVMHEADDGSFAPAIDEDTGQPQFEPQYDDQVVFDDVQDEHVSPLEFLFDSNARNIRKSSWHGMEKIVKASTLKEDPTIQIPDDLKPTSFTVKDLYGQTGDAEAYREEDSYRVITIWDKANYELIVFLEGVSTGFVKRIRRVWKSDLSIQLGKVERWPLTFDHPDDSPFSFFIPIPGNDMPFGISQVEHIRNPAMEADKTRTRMANLVRQLKRIPWFRKGAIDPAQLKAALNAADTEPVGLDIPEGADYKDLFGELPIPSVHPDLYKAEQLGADSVRWTSGISEIPFGGASTATESQNQTDIGSARPNRKRRLLLAFYTEVAERHKCFRREFDKPGQTVTVQDPSGVQTVEVYGREAFQGEIEITVMPGGEATTVSPVEQKMMVETANLFLYKISSQFDRVFIRQLLTKLDFRDVNAMLQAIPSDALQYMNAQTGVDGRLRAPAFNPNDQTNGQAIRAAINAPSEGALH